MSEAAKQIYNDSEWMQEGLCHPANAGAYVTELFVYESKEIMKKKSEEISRALAYCAGCPVRESCLDYGLRTNRNHYAIYGGRIIGPKGGIAG